MTHNEQTLLEQVADSIGYVRGRVDALDANVTTLKVSVEHRITKLEGKAAIIALVISAAISLVTAAMTR